MIHQLWPLLAILAQEPNTDWVKAHATPLSDSNPKLWKSVVGPARVVALGESAHGIHEWLALRNRLFKTLVDCCGFTAIALESGFPEGTRIADFVTGSPGDPTQTVKTGLTWGFGEFAENLELITWMRRYNADPAHPRKLHFYAIDLSMAGPFGAVPTPTALDNAITYLERVAPATAKPFRNRATPHLAKLPDGTFTAAEHDALTGLIDDIIALLERDQSTFTANAPLADYVQAHRNAIVARQADRAFRVLPTSGGDGGPPPEAWQSMSARDAAMADNVLWALQQEGPSGRILVFAHNAHTKNAATAGGPWSRLARPPASMGSYLRTALGKDLVIIGTSSRPNPSLPTEAPEVDAALATAKMPALLFDLRKAQANPLARKWLNQPRTLGANLDTFFLLTPAKAFDALVYLDTLSPTAKHNR
jgi:erythromycin esterase